MTKLQGYIVLYHSLDLLIEFVNTMYNEITSVSI